MPDQLSGFQFAGIICGTLFAVGLITLLIAWRQLKRDKLPPYDHGDITAILASNLAFEFISLLALRKIIENSGEKQ